jgi:tetratricopeptide (TPR) repeat protein
MGEVYAGLDETLKRRVALKSIRPEYRLGDFSKTQFLREARALSRLDHPNICRIYDFIEDAQGDWLVLELIEGKTLTTALPTLDAAGRLRIGRQIADVLVATHTAGIVHRDLKPGNVMLTHGGEVKVLDFGIAQPQDTVSYTPPAANAEAQVPMAADPDLTLAGEGVAASTGWIRVSTEGGAVVGTPAYMSPEQARGERASAASDMYSFGLLLQELYTGRPPYPSGIGSGDLLERARRADTLPATGAPTHIAALIARLKRLPPAQRPTAVEVAARLAWIHDRPKRLVRRAAAAVVVVTGLLGATKYTVDLARERTVAVAARQEADRRRIQAEELIGFMLGDLRKQLAPVGRLDILDGVGAQAMQYFAAVPAAVLSDEELLRRAEALYQIGDVRIAQGNLDSAMPPLVESLALARTLAQRQPQNGDRLFGLAQSHYWVGYVHWLRLDLRGAEREFNAYLDVATRLARLDESRREWQMELAYANSNLGSVLQADDNLDGALSRFRACLAIEQSLLAASPSDKELQHNVASSFNAIGLVLRLDGRLDEALESFGEELAIRQTLASGDTGNFTYRLRLAIALTHRGLVLAAQGHTTESTQELERAQAYLDELVARDSTNRAWLRERATSLFNLGGVRMASGRQGEAVPLFERAVRIMRELVDADQKNTGWQRYLAEYHAAYGDALAVVGSSRAAAREARVALALATELVARPGADSQAARIASIAHGVLARLARDSGDLDTARAHWEQGVSALAAPARTSRDYRILDPLVLALLGAGRHSEAAPVLATLQAMGYRNPVFVHQAQSATLARSAGR